MAVQHAPETAQHANEHPTESKTDVAKHKQNEIIDEGGTANHQDQSHEGFINRGLLRRADGIVITDRHAR